MCVWVLSHNSGKHQTSNTLSGRIFLLSSMDPSITPEILNTTVKEALGMIVAWMLSPPLRVLKQYIIPLDKEGGGSIQVIRFPDLAPFARRAKRPAPRRRSLWRV